MNHFKKRKALYKRSSAFTLQNERSSFWNLCCSTFTAEYKNNLNAGDLLFLPHHMTHVQPACDSCKSLWKHTPTEKNNTNDRLWHWQQTTTEMKLTDMNAWMEMTTLKFFTFSSCLIECFLSCTLEKRILSLCLVKFSEIICNLLESI